MKRLIAIMIVLAISFLLLSSCKKDSALDSAVNAESVQSTEYSTDPKSIIGTWKIAFCSTDNITYNNYEEHHSNFGFFSFYDDGTAVLQYNASEIKLYQYEVSKEFGSISFFDIETGLPQSFYFGFGTVADGEHSRIIVSRYDIIDDSVTYYIALLQAAI